MLNGDLPPQVLDLTARGSNEDQAVDHELEALRLAASSAEEAATRLNFQAASFMPSSSTPSPKAKPSPSDEAVCGSNHSDVRYSRVDSASPPDSSSARQVSNVESNGRKNLNAKDLGEAQRIGQNCVLGPFLADRDSYFRESFPGAHIASTREQSQAKEWFTASSAGETIDSDIGGDGITGKVLPAGAFGSAASFRSPNQVSEFDKLGLAKPATGSDPDENCMELDVLKPARRLSEILPTSTTISGEGNSPIHSLKGTQIPEIASKQRDISTLGCGEVFCENDRIPFRCPISGVDKRVEGQPSSWASPITEENRLPSVGKVTVPNGTCFSHVKSAPRPELLSDGSFPAVDSLNKTTAATILDKSDHNPNVSARVFSKSSASGIRVKKAVVPRYISRFLPQGHKRPQKKDKQGISVLQARRPACSAGLDRVEKNAHVKGYVDSNVSVANITDFGVGRAPAVGHVQSETVQGFTTETSKSQRPSLSPTPSQAPVLRENASGTSAIVTYLERPLTSPTNTLPEDMGRELRKRPKNATRSMSSLLLERDLARIGALEHRMHRPYLSSTKAPRLATPGLESIQDHGSRALHVDFQDEECELLCKAIFRVAPHSFDDSKEPFRSSRSRLRDLLHNVSKQSLRAAIKVARQSYPLKDREKRDIKAFCSDLVGKNIPLARPPRVSRINATYETVEPVGRSFLSTDSLLRYRELGGGLSHRPEGTIAGINRELRVRKATEFRPWRSWTGASKDVISAAWSRDGLSYACGSATDVHEMNLQYNRGNNLLFGDLESNILYELPEHHIDRPRPESITAGENSHQSTYNACDPELYTTVSAVAFDCDEAFMFTASYDKTVKIWDLSKRAIPRLKQSLKHDARLDVLAVSPLFSGLLASGQRATEKAVHVHSLSFDNIDSPDHSMACAQYSSSRSKKLELYPQCLQWGTHSQTQNLLLAGFAEHQPEDSPDAPNKRIGDLCLWDVETSQAHKLVPSSQCVFDVTWNPSAAVFAAATTPGASADLTDRLHTRSVIRTYQPLQTPSRIMEYECPASDVNDVRFHPRDDHYIAAGCTNGRVYIWDYRMPDKVLHTFRHGSPIEELSPDQPREDQDTGVCFTSWDHEGLNLYTGSSDGTIKVWDIHRSTEDALVRNVVSLDSGIMCGAFSPDYTNLLIGDAKGAVHVLSAAPFSHPSGSEDLNSDDEGITKAYETMYYIPAREPEPEISGIECARELVALGAVEIHPLFGPGKGPNYNGPYAAYARHDGANPLLDDLLPGIQAMQLDKRERKKGRKHGGEAQHKSYRNEEKVAKARNSEGWRSQLASFHDRDHLGGTVEVEKSARSRDMRKNKHGTIKSAVRRRQSRSSSSLPGRKRRKLNAGTSAAEPIVLDDLEDNDTFVEPYVAKSASEKSDVDANKGADDGSDEWEEDYWFD